MKHVEYLHKKTQKKKAFARDVLHSKCALIRLSSHNYCAYKTSHKHRKQTTAYK